MKEALKQVELILNKNLKNFEKFTFELGKDCIFSIDFGLNIYFDYSGYYVLSLTEDKSEIEICQSKDFSKILAVLKAIKECEND